MSRFVLSLGCFERAEKVGGVEWQEGRAWGGGHLGGVVWCGGTVGGWTEGTGREVWEGGDGVDGWM